MDIEIIKKYLTGFQSNLRPLLHDIVQKKIQRAATARLQQANLIKKTLSISKERYIIVLGDLNDPPLSPTLFSLRENLKDAFIGSGKGIGVTHHFFKSSLLRIDYMLHSNNITPFDFHVNKLPYSDHYPIICTFGLN
jgi:endonuclease/exonuclease/phosphatase family metal-dependent hydrolase